MERAGGPGHPAVLGGQGPLGLPDHAAIGLPAGRARVRQPRHPEGRGEPRGAELPRQFPRSVRRRELSGAARGLSDRLPGRGGRHHHDHAAASLRDADRRDRAAAASRPEAHPRRPARHAGLFGEETRSPARHRKRPRPSLGGAARSRVRRAVQRRRRACDLRGAEGRCAEGGRRRRSEGRPVPDRPDVHRRRRCRRAIWST